MSLLTSIFLVVSLAVISGLVIWLIILFFKEEAEKHDSPMIINMMSNYSHPSSGHAIGLEVSTTKIDNRFLVEYQPRDIDDKLLLNKKEINNVKVVVNRNKIITLEKGTLSNYRTIKILLAPNAEDYPQELKLTPFGQMIMNLTEGINAFNLESHIVREGSSRKTKILTKLGDGEVSQEYMDAIDDQTKELAKRGTSENKNPQRPSGGGFSPPNM